MKQGIVLSDLHLFTKRSQTDHILNNLYKQLPQCGHLVLNGDIFDTRWTTLPSIQHLVSDAQKWMATKKAPHLFADVYELSDKVGLTELSHKLFFPKERVARRIIHYLTTLPGGFPVNCRHIYYGHTHLPFANFVWNGYAFHNTGSAVRCISPTVGCFVHVFLSISGLLLKYIFYPEPLTTCFGFSRYCLR